MRRLAIFPAEQQAVVAVVGTELGSLGVELVDQDPERSERERVERDYSLRRQQWIHERAIARRINALSLRYAGLIGATGWRNSTSYVWERTGR